MRTPWVWLSLLVMTAAVLRAMALGAELWLDEMVTFIISIQPPFFELITVYKGDNQHPLYSLLAHLSTSIFGDTPWAMRLPATLFGIASVPMLFVLGRRIVSQWEALLAAALLAVSYHHVWFSQNARGYTMLAFWAILATDLLLRGIREERRSMFVGYAVVVALGIYTHLTMVFLVAAHVLVCAWMAFSPRVERRLDWRLPFIGFAVGGILTLALYGPILSQVLNWFMNRPSRLLSVSTPEWALGEGLRILRLGLGAGWSIFAAGAVFGVGLVSYARRSPLVFTLFVLPGLTTMAGALLGRGTMYPRFYFFLIGFAMLIILRGAMVIGEFSGRLIARSYPRERLGLAIGNGLAALMILASLMSLRYNYAYPKQPFLAAAAHVEANARPGEPVAVLNASRYAYLEYYGKPWTRIAHGDELNALRVSGNRVWLVYTFPRYLELEAPEVMETILSECGSATKFDGTVGDGDVFACVLPPAV
ncbi:MAG TPA: glycosyltransferase family 39 protein [Gemmatimonadaceae bacterium]|nr:glycosyltransferase family 39 protein [Gemmatimonadaceae bacterium]